MLRLFRPNSMSYVRMRRPMRAMQRRTVVSVSDLGGTYDAFNSKKHLSPVYGAAFVVTGELTRLYDISIAKTKNDAAAVTPITAIQRLVTSLFHKIQNDLRVTHAKSHPAYVLTPVLLGKILHHQDAGNLIDHMDSIVKEWRDVYRKQLGSNLSKTKIIELINLITEAKKECQHHLYPENMTETILLAFLYKKSKSREDIIDFIHVLDNYNSIIDHTVLDNSVRINKQYINNGKEMIREINGLDNQAAKDLLKIKYEMILLTLMLKDGLPDYVEMDNYGYKGADPKPNCAEAAFHNFCNTILFDLDTSRFNFSLLPSTLKPHEKLITLYEMQDYQVGQVNSMEVGQAFMDMISESSSIIYVNGNYEIETTVDNFIPVINLLFGINAENFDDLSRLFTDERRVIKFERDDNNVIITMNPDMNNAYKMQFTFSNWHCSFENDFTNMENSFQKKYVKFSELAISEFNEHPVLFSVLHDIYSVVFSSTNLANSVTDVSVVNSHIFYNSPLCTYDVHKLVQLIVPYLHDYPHFKDYIKCLVKEYPSVIETFISTGDRDVVSLLLDCGANPNLTYISCDYMAPLIFLAPTVDILDLLVRAGADLNAKDENGHTILHAAIEEIKMVKYLLEAKIDPNIRSKDGCTPLMTYHHVPEVTKLLCEFGADFDMLDDEGRPLIFYHLDSPHILEAILSAGANPNRMNTNGCTALFFCNKAESARLLLKYGANPMLTLANGNTPLHFVRNAEVAQVLIDAGADCSALNKSGITPFASVRTNPIFQVRNYKKPNETPEDRILAVLDVFERAKSQANLSGEGCSSYKIRYGNCERE